jgi:hypothetical protein
MSHDLATFLVSALLVFGTGAFLIVFSLALWRHLRWRSHVRRRIGWYS